MNTSFSTFTRRFLGNFRDFGTGRLPADSQLKNKRYLIMAAIGKGGMGAVYLAHDTSMRNRLVAIKEMSQSKLLNSQALHHARQSFQQEASMLSQLQYPNLPEVYDSFQENGRSYLVMEYIKGKTLAEVLKQHWNAPLPIVQTVEYGLQLCSVLTYLHTRQPPIIYLDLKPQNIMLRENDGRIFLIDFGIARVYQRGMLQASGDIFCTPGYAPPEQMAGQPEPRSDLFALGATLHQCLTGQNPQAHTREHLFDFPPARLLNPQVPDELNLLVSQALNVDQYKRPASAARVEQELEHIHRRLANPVVLGGYSSMANPASPTIPAGSTVSTPTPIPSSPITNNWARVAQLFPDLAEKGRKLGFSLFSFGKNGVFPSLMAMVNKPFQEAIRLVSNQKIWDARFAALLLAVLVLSTGGSLSLLRSAPDANHTYILGLLLMIFVLVLIGFHLTGKYLDGHVPRAVLALMGLALAVAAFALQAMPDVEAVVQPLVQRATLNQVCILGLLAIAGICLFRPEQRLALADHLLLGALAACGALFQYNSGQYELAQFSVISSASQPVVNAILFWTLLGIALLAWLLVKRPFQGPSRFALLLVAAIFAAFQYIFGLPEFQAFRATDQALIVFSFAYTWTPLVCAALALFTGRAWLTRLTLLVLTIAQVTMLGYQGQFILFPFSSSANPYPLSVNVLNFATFYQFLGPLLFLIAFLSLARLRSKGSYRWIDHALLLLGAFLAAHLDQAFWQAQHDQAVLSMDQNGVHQQYTILVGFLPAYLIYGLLILFPLILLARSICHFWRQAHPYARVDRWLNGLQTTITYIERLLALALVSIAFLLSGALGLFTMFFDNTLGQHFTGQAPDLFLLCTLGLLALLAVLGAILLILLIFLLRRKIVEPGRVERLVVLSSALVFLLLVWQNPQMAALPLLSRPIQLTGNFFHWSDTTLAWLLLGGLALIPCFAFFWFQRSLFSSYRDLFYLLFLLVLVCALLQIIWPIFLPVGLLCLIPGILLAVQIEKVG